MAEMLRHPEATMLQLEDTQLLRLALDPRLQHLRDAMTEVDYPHVRGTIPSWNVCTHSYCLVRSRLHQGQMTSGQKARRSD